MTNTNTKARHLEILSAAHELLADVDVTTDYPFKTLARRLADQTSCHIDTARRNLAKAARRKRYQIVKNENWGGSRPNSGRPRKYNYKVIEDNGGGMYLFFFDDDGRVILGIENIEFAQPGDLDKISFDEAKTWDSQLDEPQAVYDNITSYEFGWVVVADQDGVYPDRMGRAAQLVYGV